MPACLPGRLACAERLSGTSVKVANTGCMKEHIWAVVSHCCVIHLHNLYVPLPMLKSVCQPGVPFSPVVLFIPALLMHSYGVCLLAMVQHAWHPCARTDSPLLLVQPLHMLCRQFVAGPLTHCMLGFEVQGGWRDVKTSVVMTALQYLMGGGGSFSAGGPGTALHFTLVADLPLAMNHSQLEAQVQLFTLPLGAHCILYLPSA